MYLKFNMVYCIRAKLEMYHDFTHCGDASVEYAGVAFLFDMFEPKTTDIAILRSSAYFSARELPSVFFLRMSSDG